MVYLANLLVAMSAISLLQLGVVWGRNGVALAVERDLETLRFEAGQK